MNVTVRNLMTNKKDKPVKKQTIDINDFIKKDKKPKQMYLNVTPIEENEDEGMTPVKKRSISSHNVMKHANNKRSIPFASIKL